MTRTDPDHRRVVVVTGGGAGIGAAVATELGAAGCFVVTLDPLVTLDGSSPLPAAEETTAGRIVAAGGAARASAVSVADADGVRRLFEGLVEELGRLDAVVNVAGITRPTSFARGTEEDWSAVLSVHLDGYVNVLRAALPIMAAAGRGHILGVTSGSGWRPADAGAYGCAKRAVASLTWELGRTAPDGVVINAMSPIAATRMVTAALARSPKTGGSSATGGLSLGSMPTAEQIGPIGAHLVGAGFAACRGQVIFAGGSELAVVERPRLLELLRTDGVASLASAFDAVVPTALARAEAAQASTGGSNPRFPDTFEVPVEAVPATPASASCVVVTDRVDLAAAMEGALAARGITSRTVDPWAVLDGLDADALVVAIARSGSDAVVADHVGLAEEIRTDARWSRFAADHAASSGRSLRLVTLTDARSSGGRTRAQAAAQLSRSARGATSDKVDAFAVSVEADDPSATAELAAHLVGHPDAGVLSGAELVVAAGWVGLRSHPRPGAAIVLDAAVVPSWFDSVIAEATR